MELTEQQQNFLGENGYLLIPEVLSSMQVERMRDRLDELEAEEGLFAGSARQTSWQRQAQKRNNWWGRCVSSAHGAFYLSIKYIALRWVFPRAASFKADMERWSEPVPLDKSIWQKLRYEVLSMIHAAAVQEHGALRICDLVNKGDVFETCLIDSRVLAAVRQVIGHRVVLSSLNYRAAEPGGGLQPLHVDWFDERPEGGQVPACNTLWLLDDITPTNGPTRVVPRTHRLPYGPSVVADDLQAPYPHETFITAKAGSVVIINGQLWHSGTDNRTRQRRRLLQAYFVGPGVRPQLEQSAFVTQSTLSRLSLQAREVLGV